MIPMPSTSRARARTVEEKFPLPSWTTRSRVSSGVGQMLDRVAALGNALVNLGSTSAVTHDTVSWREVGISSHSLASDGAAWRARPTW